MFYKQQKLVAICYCQNLMFDEHFYKPFSGGNKLLEHIEEYLNHRKYPVLTIGSLFKDDLVGYYFDSSSFNFDELTKAFKHWIKTSLKKSQPVLYSINNAPIEDKQNLIKSGFTLLESDLKMCFNIDHSWNDFEDYKQSLKKNYRQRIVKIEKESADLVRSELTLTELISYKDQLNILYQNVIKGQSIKLGLINADYIINLKKEYKNNFLVKGYFKNNQLVAFATIFKQSQDLVIHFIGFEANTSNTPSSCYLKILCDSLNDGILGKYKRVWLGRTALEAKAMMGATPVNVNTWYKTTGSITGLVINYFLQRFNEDQGDAWKTRNPFKEIRTNELVVV